MAKEYNKDDDALLSELGVEVEVKKTSNRTPREERIIAGFEEIEKFIEENGHLPKHGEDKDIFERIYAVRLDQLRRSEECVEVLKELDSSGLLEDGQALNTELLEDIDDDELLAELGVEVAVETDIRNLKHVRSSAEIKTAEEIGRHAPCMDFDKFKPLFEKVNHEIKGGVRKSREYKNDGKIEKDDFFILSGVVLYIAEVGEEFLAANGTRPDVRLRVIYANGTESNILRRSLQRALNKDSHGKTGRRITNPEVGPLFSDEQEDDDIESGTIYVLRSKSEHVEIKKNHKVLHKVGVTGGSVEKRIANAKLDPTFLMADVEIVATYKLSNLNRMKFENLLHRFFEGARLDLEIPDRMGIPIRPREWFLVPLDVIDRVIAKIIDGTISKYQYDIATANLKST